jgi:ubiquinone/menaquinone biosynthesis C-methylase UbiE
MKMAGIENFFVRSALRVYIQRKFEAPKVLSNLNLGKDSRCIEIGCGKGAGTLLINRYVNCKQVIGIDIDPDMIKAAKRYIFHPPRWAKSIRTDNIEFVCEDATSLSFADNYFDVAFLFGVLDHILGWQKAISEIYRVLKAGGIFSFEDFLYNAPLFSRFPGHVPISKGKLKESLEKAGFSVQSFETTKFLPRCFVRAVKSRT